VVSGDCQVARDLGLVGIEHGQLALLRQVQHEEAARPASADVANAARQLPLDLVLTERGRLDRGKPQSGVLPALVLLAGRSVIFGRLFLDEPEAGSTVARAQAEQRP